MIDEARGDARIARAFRRSLAAAALLAAGALAAWWLLRPGPPPQTAGSDAPAPAPVPAAAAPEPPALPFTDVTGAAGIAFRHENGAYGERLLPETLGSGVAVLDYDGDGHQDLLFVNGRPWPWREAAGAPPTPALYRNTGAGRFEDVTAAAGLGDPLYGMGVAAADLDDDGDPDLYFTALGPNRLYENRGGRFHDVTAQAGVAGAGDAWSTGAAFLDHDRDGDLDLFVVNYVEWSRDIDLEVDFRLTGIGRAYGPPTHFAGTFPVLYRNEGDGAFTDISAEAGVRVAHPDTGAPEAKALAALPLDLDRDGWLDLFVANDTVRNFLLHNREGRFQEAGTLYGVAFDRAGAATGAMGVDAADFRNDGELAIAVGNFANEMSSLYVTQGGGPPLADESILEGLGPASRLALTFGVLFLDADLDGRLDLVQANGHLEEAINQVQPSQHYAQPAQLFWNCGAACRGSLLPVPAKALGDLAEPAVGRGAAYGDLDGDGDLDLVITQNGRRARVLRNDQDLGHHWLRLELVGGGPVPRDPVGARVRVTAAGVTQERAFMPQRSYLSQVERPLTFGLGEADAVERVEVLWPDGRRQVLEDPAVDRLHVIRHPGAE